MAETPNIVLVISDDHRFDCIGAMSPKIQTPSLDRLAAEGTHFRQATAATPLCAPDRATLLTGLMSHTHGMKGNNPLGAWNTATGPDLPMLPKLLQTACYHTALVGKWQLIPEPWNLGFAEMPLWSPDQAGDYLDPQSWFRGPSRTPVPLTGYATDLLTAEATAFLERQSAVQPFFLWLSYHAPHSPYGPNPTAFTDLYAGQSNLAPPGFPPDGPVGFGWKSYYSAISHMDAGVGQVLDTLAAQGLDSNTLVVFVGDNGYMSGSHNISQKIVPFDESARVPLLIRRGRGEPARVSDLPVTTADLPPTLLQAAGLPVPASWQGRALTGILDGVAGNEAHFSEAFVEYDGPALSIQWGKNYRMVRTQAAKLVRWKPALRPDTLFDLAADPFEARDVAGEAGYAPLLAQMRARLAAWMVQTNDPARNW